MYKQCRCVTIPHIRSLHDNVVYFYIVHFLTTSVLTLKFHEAVFSHFVVLNHNYLTAVLNDMKQCHGNGF